MSTRTDRRGGIGDSNGRPGGTRDVGTSDHRLSKYDLFLAVLPLPLLVEVGWSTLASVPLSAGAGLGSVPSALLLAYGLFVGGPSPRTGVGPERPGRRRTDSQVRRSEAVENVRNGKSVGKDASDENGSSSASSGYRAVGVRSSPTVDITWNAAEAARPRATSVHSSVVSPDSRSSASGVRPALTGWPTGG